MYSLSVKSYGRIVVNLALSCSCAFDGLSNAVYVDDSSKPESA